MLWVDNAIIALIIIYTIGGFIRGYSQEMFSMAIWAIGFLAAWFFSHNFALLLAKQVDAPIRLAVAFIAMLSITLIAGGVINLLLGESFKKTGLSLLDRAGGIILGFFHSFLVVFVLAIMAGLTSLPKENWWHQSIFLPSFHTMAVVTKHLTEGTKMSAALNYPKLP